VLDNEIEYRMLPDREYRRFGNRIAINEFGMRASSFSETKTSDDELRVLFIGDSIVYGGHHVDQAELATERIGDALKKAFPERTVIVGSAAASSWGVPNMLAYLERYGTFDADYAVLVLSNHDITDLPTFNPDTVPYATAAPVCALHDALRSLMRQGLDLPQSSQEARSVQREEVLGAFARLVGLLRADGIPVLLALHPTRAEAFDAPLGGLRTLEKEAASLGIGVVLLHPHFQRAQAQGVEPYSDSIHPNAAGMAVIAEAITDALLEEMGSPDRG
jgi:lysophospholipase L1-like esterase